MCRTVHGRVRRRGPEYKVLVIGAVPPQQVHGLPVEIVSLTGDSINLNFMNCHLNQYSNIAYSVQQI